MSDAIARALTRLRQSQSEALRRLARLTVDDLSARPVAELLPPEWLASRLLEIGGTLAADEGVREAIDVWGRARLAEWERDERTVRQLVPEAAQQVIVQTLEQPWVPDESLMMRLVDQRLVSGLVREILQDTITRFRTRLTGIDRGLFKGLGGRAARRGRGLLGGVAEGFVGAVKDGVEAKVDAIVDEFLGQATRDALGLIARHVANPDHADAYAELRSSIWSTIAETDVGVLVREATKLDAEPGLELFTTWIARAVEQPETKVRLEAVLAARMGELGDGSIRSALRRLDLWDAWADVAEEWIAGRMASIVASDEFGEWWNALFADDSVSDPITR